MIAVWFLACLQMAYAANSPSWFSECEGFGCDVTKKYHHSSCVADLTEDSLRNCMNKDYVHITFKDSGTINLKNPLEGREGLILDGSGYSVKIADFGVKVKSNSIFYRVQFQNGDAGDALTLRGAYSNVWIHKCTFKNFKDGLIDITRAFTMVTVSYNELHSHNKAMLISAGVDSKPPFEDENIRVSIHHNYFHDLVQRQPRVRYAFVHIYNNYYLDWTSYAIGCSQRSRCLLENNWFQSNTKSDKNVITKVGDDPDYGYIKSKGNHYEGGSCKVEKTSSKVPSSVPYQYNLQSPADAKNIVLAKAGYNKQ